VAAVTIDPLRNVVRFTATGMDTALLGGYYFPVRDLTNRDAAQRARRAASDEREADLERRAAELRIEREAETARLHQRHADLVTTHAGNPILAALLAEHAPHKGGPGLECRGCPENHDTEYGCEFMAWPCPTWTTIANNGRPT